MNIYSMKSGRSLRLRITYSWRTYSLLFIIEWVHFFSFDIPLNEGILSFLWELICLITDNICKQREIVVARNVVTRQYKQKTLEEEKIGTFIWKAMAKASPKMVKIFKSKDFQKYLIEGDLKNRNDFFEGVCFPTSPHLVLVTSFMFLIFIDSYDISIGT